MCWHGFFFIIMEKLSPSSAPLAAEVLPNGLINMIYFQCNYLIWAFARKVWAIQLKPVKPEYHHQIPQKHDSVSTVRDICVPFWCTIGGLCCWAENRHVLRYMLCYFSHVFRKLLLPPRCPLHQRHKSEMFYDTFIKMMFAFAEVDVFLCQSESSCSSTKCFTQRISGFLAFDKPLLPLRSKDFFCSSCISSTHTPRAHPDNMDHVIKTAQDQLQEPGFTVPQIQISLSFWTWDLSKKYTIYGFLLIWRSSLCLK